MRRSFLLLSLVLAVAAVSSPMPVGSEALSATATGVGISPTNSACSDNPSFEISGQGVGDGFGEDGWGTVAGQAAPRPQPQIATSPLFDDWDFTDSDFGIVLDTTPSPGDLVGGYAVIGTPDLDPATTAEWFVLWSCGATSAESVLRAFCVGPYGTCPRTVDEALTLGIDFVHDGPGFLLASVRGCYGGDVTLAVVPGDDPDGEPSATAGPVAQQPEGVDLELDTSAVGDGPGWVVATCSIEGVAPLAVAIPQPPPATTAATAEPPPATAAPAAATPRFTG